MWLAIATLAALSAMAPLEITAGAFEVRFASTPQPKRRVARRPKPPRPKSKLPKRPPAAKTPAPERNDVPLARDVGSSESDVARLEHIRARRTALEAQILTLTGQADSTLKDLDSIDLELRIAGHRFTEAELEFKETRRLLDATLREAQATRDRLEITRPRVQKSLSALNKLGELSYARLLFSIDDPADILRGYRYVSRIASVDAERIKAFRASLLQQSSLEEQLKGRTARNLETRRRLNAARTALSARKAAREQRLLEITREQRLQEELAVEYRNQEAALLRLLGEGKPLTSGGEALSAAPPVTSFQGGPSLRSARGNLRWPVHGALLRKFGVERDPRFGTHTIQQGIEIDAYPENAVRAVHAGRVVYADQFVGYGMLVIVDHGRREHTLYGRLGELRVAKGDAVAEGALVGLLPDTRVTGSGLHFEVRVEGKPEDPLDWLKKP